MCQLPAVNQMLLPWSEIWVASGREQWKEQGEAKARPWRISFPPVPAWFLHRIALSILGVETLHKSLNDLRLGQRASEASESSPSGEERNESWDTGHSPTVVCMCTLTSGQNPHQGMHTNQHRMSHCTVIHLNMHPTYRGLATILYIQPLMCTPVVHQAAVLDMCMHMYIHQTALMKNLDKRTFAHTQLNTSIWFIITLKSMHTFANVWETITLITLVHTTSKCTNRLYPRRDASTHPSCHQHCKFFPNSC